MRGGRLVNGGYYQQPPRPINFLASLSVSTGIQMYIIFAIRRQSRIDSCARELSLEEQVIQINGGYLFGKALLICSTGCFDNLLSILLILDIRYAAME